MALTLALALTLPLALLPLTGHPKPGAALTLTATRLQHEALQPTLAPLALTLAVLALTVLPLALLTLLLAPDHLAQLAHHALHLLALFFAHLLARHPVQLFGHPAHRFARLLLVPRVAVEVLRGVPHLAA